MKIPKQFLYFLVLAQAILTAGHFLLYQSLVFFFPAVAAHRPALLVVLLVLSAGFLIASILDFKKQNPLLRWIYILSGIWIVLWFYLLLASAVSSAIYLLFPGAGLQNIAAVIFSIALIITIYGIVNARVIRVTKIKVNLPNLPSFWKGKTAVMASDTHLGHVLRQKSAVKIVSAINKLNPEVIFIPGDIFDGVHTDFKGLFGPFKGLSAPSGVYFCSGNHELYAGMAECEQAIRDAGIVVLENQKVEIQGLQIVGLAYGINQTDENIKDALMRLSLNQNLPTILLKHVPAQIPVAAQAGISLMLSGHSHHGQVWPFRYITSKIFKGFDYGLKNYQNLQVYTSSGVGTWGPPVRFLTKAEIVQITFM